MHYFQKNLGFMIIPNVDGSAGGLLLLLRGIPRRWQVRLRARMQRVDQLTPRSQVG
jgi:hypothetical protein